VAVCEAIGVGLMFVIYALLGQLNGRSLLGGLLGGLVAVLNFLALSVTVSLAADRAERTGDWQRAQLSIRSSAVFRLLVMGVVLFFILKTDRCDVLATLLPLVFVKPSLMLIEYFRKGDDTSK